tara:strand:- start:237 stop:368 length:132 start_codon:yes stop_codon:yes gene_type:complete
LFCIEGGLPDGGGGIGGVGGVGAGLFLELEFVFLFSFLEFLDI